MTFLHRLRQSANRALRRFGFELVRHEYLGSDSGLVSMKIGDYELSIQAGNSLWREYKKNPEYTAQLGRIAGAVFEAYPAGYAIDIGANVGDTAALIKSHAQVPILCVEGDSAVFPLLEKNVSAMKDVSVHCQFLGERTEDVRVMIEKDGWDATLVPSDVDSAESSRTLSLLSLTDLLLRAQTKGACKLLKVDIEGFDLRVIRGATSLLRSDRPVILFEFNYQNLTKLGEDGLAIYRYLADQGYDRLHIYDAQGFFLTQCPTSDAGTLGDLDNYARCVQGLFYYDICAFHSSDSHLADRILESERAHRTKLIQARLEAESS